MQDKFDYGEMLLRKLRDAVRDLEACEGGEEDSEDNPLDLVDLLNQPKSRKAALARVKECGDECRVGGLSEAQIYELTGEDLIAAGNDQDD